MSVAGAGRLPRDFEIGHWSDPEGLTGCTVVLCPDGAVGSCFAPGGAPGSRETDLLSPAAAQPGPNAILLTGGSAFGLAAAEGVVGALEARGVGFPTPAGPVPLVPAAVVYDLMLGDAAARPGPAEGALAVAAASGGWPERGSVGVGTGCTVGKALGPAAWERGGFGAASRMLPSGATVAAMAAVNAFGDVITDDGRTLAGVRSDDGARTDELLLRGNAVSRLGFEATTLACVLTDARLSKLETWLVARASAAGIARAVVPAWTRYDGDVCFCVARGEKDEELVAVSAVAAGVVAAAIRDAVEQATAVAGCPARTAGS
jgi:L-aminopeptidase/D-esterase-like protein